MTAVVSRFLEPFPLVSTDGPVDLLAGLERLYGAKISPLAGWGHVGYVLRGVHGEGYDLGFIHSSLGVAVDGRAVSSSYFANFVVAGNLRSERNGERLSNSVEMATVFNPGDRQILYPGDAPAENFAVRLARGLVEEELRGLLGRPLDGPVLFDFGVDLTAHRSAALGAMLTSLVRDLDSGNSIFRHPRVLEAHMRSFASGLLLAHRHNYSSRLAIGHEPARPRHLRRAVDYLEVNLSEGLTLGQLANAAGCSVRTLNSAFNEHFDCSPMAFVESRRLDHVRADLSEGVESVGASAYKWGFTHLGRFAQKYAARFGELPSQTLAAASV